MKKLVDLAKKDVIFFLDNYKDLFFNECDLQMNLAQFLNNNREKYDCVYLEYFVPGSTVQKQIANSLIPPYSANIQQNLYIDIVVEKDGEFLPIELKYKTAPLKKNIFRFGEELQGVNVLKNQGARDLGAYDFWRDVNRIECLIKRFDNVKNGIVLFVTNDQGYWTLPKKGTSPNYVNFSMRKGVHDPCKTWQGNTAMSASRPSFKLETDYPIQWMPIVIEKETFKKDEFRYCLLEI